MNLRAIFSLPLSSPVPYPCAPMRALALICAVTFCCGCPSGEQERGTTAPAARGGSSGARTGASLMKPPAKTSKPKPKKTPRASVLPGLGRVTAPDDLPAPITTAIAAGGSFTGQIEQPSDRDCFELPTAQGETLSVQAHSCGEIRLRLLDPAGAEVAAGIGKLEHVAHRSGGYVLELRAGAGQGLFYALERR